MIISGDSYISDIRQLCAPLIPQIQKVLWKIVIPFKTTFPNFLKKTLHSDGKRRKKPNRT